MSWRAACSLAALTACWHAAPPKAMPVSEATENLAPPKTEPGAVLTPDVVIDRISSSYNGQIRRCYQKLLKHHAGARGKVTLSFTIDATGHVVKPHAEGMPPVVSTCIQRAMSAWYFAPPPSDPDEASFRIPLQLVAN